MRWQQCIAPRGAWPCDAMSRVPDKATFRPAHRHEVPRASLLRGDAESTAPAAAPCPPGAYSTAPEYVDGSETEPIRSMVSISAAKTLRSGVISTVGSPTTPCIRSAGLKR